MLCWWGFSTLYVWGFLSICLEPMWICVMTVPSLSVPCLTLPALSHPSSLAPGAKYAMHLVLGFLFPSWPKMLCFPCIMIGVYIYAMNTNLQPSVQGWPAQIQHYFHFVAKLSATIWWRNVHKLIICSYFLKWTRCSFISPELSLFCPELSI